MEKQFIAQWDARKSELETWFRENNQLKYNSYEAIVRKILEIVMTDERWNMQTFRSIDNGHYQGTEIFICAIDTYQPSATEYMVTNTYYGSCSGCDTLQGINGYSEGTPTEEQVKEYMTLALHLVQRMKWLFDNND